MKTLRVLLVDDDPAFLEFAVGALSRARYSVTPVSDFEAAAETLSGFKGQAVVLSDLIVGNRSGLAFLEKTLRKYPFVPFTLLDKSPTLKSVLEALKQGAYDFLRKPVAPEILCQSVARSVEKVNLVLEGERQERENRKLLAQSRAECEKAKNISAFKGFLISTTAHDFNSTLTVLDGYNEVIKKRCRECREPQAVHLLEQVRRSISRLRTMSATLLDYEAAESGTLRVNSQGFDLTELLKECVSFYRPYAEQKQIVLNMEGEAHSLTVLGDPGRVMQVLENLLYNAVKFTPPKGEISVGARADDGKVATIWVRDTGIGLSKKVQETIFSDASGGSDKDAGARMGLGLVICRRLIEIQNGKIWLESTPGKGTVVSFSLPM
ncbi:MAG: hybrid sensor histidine kinase/response regulator [Candidatus Deferrimicrobiaceae bacterium]